MVPAPDHEMVVHFNAQCLRRGGDFARHGNIAATRRGIATWMVVDGDYAVVTLDSLSGVEQPVHQDEVVLHVGDPDTMAGFSEALRGLSPEEEKEFEVTYPEDFGQARLAGKTVRFRAKLTTIRTKELPELNDEFAKEKGRILARS